MPTEYIRKKEITEIVETRNKTKLKVESILMNLLPKSSKASNASEYFSAKLKFVFPAVLSLREYGT
jgi:hypothetical protein